MRQESLLMFGEGKIDGIFLKHIARVYGDPSSLRIKVDRGQGGSPDCVVNKMIKTQLDIANYDRALLLLDGDLPIGTATTRKLRDRGITLVLSEPQCIEGFILAILNDLPKRQSNLTSKALKRRLWKNHLKTDRESEAVNRLQRTIADLLQKEILDAARNDCSGLNQLISFLSA